MKKIGIIICGRYQGCGGGKCFRALRERVGAFSAYPREEPVAGMEQIAGELMHEDRCIIREYN